MSDGTIARIPVAQYVDLFEDINELKKAVKILLRQNSYELKKLNQENKQLREYVGKTTSLLLDICNTIEFMDDMQDEAELMKEIRKQFNLDEVKG